MVKITKDTAVTKMKELLIQVGWEREIDIDEINFNTTYFDECYDEDGIVLYRYWRLTERDDMIYFVECDKQGKVLEWAFDEEVSDFYRFDNQSEIEDIKFLINEILIPSVSRFISEP